MLCFEQISCKYHNRRMLLRNCCRYFFDFFETHGNLFILVSISVSVAINLYDVFYVMTLCVD